MAQLTDEIKQEIQAGYRRFLETRSLRPRHGQKLMIAAIARTLGGIESDASGERTSQNHVCVVEAGTGTGKTVAYALAAIPVAKALGKRLVISTATVALQEQIVNRDLPDVQATTGLEFSFELAKGRGRYLCINKLDDKLAGSDQTVIPLYPDEEVFATDADTMALYQGMLEALSKGEWVGDRDHWSYSQLSDEAWRGVASDHRQCTGRRCDNVGHCPFFKARETLGRADVVVTNHDMVMADLSLGGGAILPEPKETIYIFDEGHHLPDKALGHFAHHTRIDSTTRWLASLGRNLLQASVDIEGGDTMLRMLEELPSKLDDIQIFQGQVLPLIETIAEFDTSRDQGSPRYRFDRGEVPQTLADLAVELGKQYFRAQAHCMSIVGCVEELMDVAAAADKPPLEAVHAAISTAAARLEGNALLWRSYAEKDNDLPRARWITMLDQSGTLDYEICSSPILADQTLSSQLWEQAYGAVVTSATLTALNSFDHFIHQSGVPSESHLERVPSPFDFAANGRFYVPPMRTLPNDVDGHTDEITEIIPQLLSPSKGSLVLFTSRRQMHNVYENLSDEVAGRVLMQGDRSKQAILDEHRSRIEKGEPSVLFGLASFAEGLDLPGDQCEEVIITKLPFSVPDDPVSAARGEWIETQGRNSFMELSVPEAAQRLVQAAGRLLRTEQDQGRVSLLDRRVVTKRYGAALLGSLPPFTQQIS